MPTNTNIIGKTNCWREKYWKLFKEEEEEEEKFKTLLTI